MGGEALIAALVGKGWDDPVEPDLEAASGLLADDPDLGRQDVWLAAATGEVEALRAFVDEDASLANRPGGPRNWPPVLYAAYSFAHRLDGREPGLVAGLEALLAAGADPNAHYRHPDHDNGFSALYATIAVTSHRARIYALLAAGAKPSDGNSTFHAVETFDLDLLEALAANGIDTDDASYTVMHALDMGFEDAVELFLRIGADPNATHPAAGETTLHWAVKRGASTRVLTWLLDAGADANRGNANGRAGFLDILGHTPLDFALRLGHTEAIALLEARGGVPSPTDAATELVHAVARGDETAARALLDADPEGMATLPDEDRRLLAHWAQHDRDAAVALGIELGFDIDSSAWMGLTAVHWAALRGNPRTLQMLLDAGAKVVDLGGYFGTPRHTAETCQWHAGDYDAVLALLA